MSASIEYQQPMLHTDEEGSRLASALRWLGAAALSLSAVVFLLQGLEQVDLAIRNWSFLVLMAALGGLGVAVRQLFNDARSARLLLGLALAVIPIQFAQLGGLLLSLLSSEATVLGGPLLETAPVSAGSALAVAVASFALYAPIAYAGFAVLARPQARDLCLYLLAPVVMLLLPWRDSIAGFALVASLGALTLYKDRQLTALHARFRTLEGRAVRAILAIPCIIATVRLGFHADELAGACGMLGFFGVASMAVAQCLIGTRRFRTLVYVSGSALTVCAWLIWSSLTPALGSGTFDTALLLGPVGVFLLIAGSAGASRIYRGIGSAILAIISAELLAAVDASLALVTLVFAGVLLGFGVLGRFREPVYVAAAILVASVLVLVLESPLITHVGNWTVLAALGVVLVLVASFVERYGRRAVARLQQGISEVNAWQ